MPSILSYGIDSSVRLDLSDAALVAQCGNPEVSPLDSPSTATFEALDHPLDYPPLRQCTTPGDRIAIALDENVPRAAEIVAAVIDYLVSSAVDPDGITVVRTQADVDAGTGDPRPRLTAELIERITFVTHDPADRASLAYLAMTEDSEPIFLNRAITDADLVLPISCLRHRAAGYYGIHTAVFPTFSDHRTLKRFRSPSSLNGDGHPKRQVLKVVDQVGWLLGITLTIQVIPAQGDQILHVLAGRHDLVRHRAQRLYRSVWGGSVPRRASLVVAAIEGGPAQQSWQNVGRALANAAALVEDDGAVAVCCDLADVPGPAVEQLAAARSRKKAVEWIRKNRPPDALPATQLAQIQDRVKVYLLSRLDESLVESLEMVPITTADEIARLAGRHPSCILLSNAPCAMVTVEESA